MLGGTRALRRMKWSSDCHPRGAAIVCEFTDPVSGVYLKLSKAVTKEELYVATPGFFWYLLRRLSEEMARAVEAHRRSI